MHVDWAGAVLLIGGMTCLLVGVSQGETWGWSSSTTLGVTATGVLTLASWIVWTLRSSSPLVDLRLAARPGLAAPNLVAVVAGIGMYSLLTLSVVLVRADGPDFGLGRSVVVAGLLLVPYSFMSILGNRAARAARSRMGQGALLPIGCAIFLSATLFLAHFHDQLWQALVAMALGGVGSGFTFSSLAVLMVPHVPAAETSSALAFNQVLRYLGFTVGSAVSPVLMAALGGGGSGFRGALLAVSTVWFMAGVGAALLDRSLVSHGPPGRGTHMVP
jgi:predicted MFS family arabinose efflux permease